MGIAYVRIGSVMGAGAPVYNPPRASATVNTTTTNQTVSFTILDGDYVRVVARGAAIHVAISKTAATEQRDTVSDGAAIDIGPLKAGDVINLADAI